LFPFITIKFQDAFLSLINIYSNLKYIGINPIGFLRINSLEIEHNINKFERRLFLKMANVVILYSGGADSLLMLKLAQMAGKVPYCVLVDYGQKHVKELEYAENQLEKFDVRYQVVKIENYNVNSGLTGDGIKGRYEGVSVYNVPARNTIFLSIAAGVAESLGLKEVWIGCDMSDFYGNFPDCKQSYIGKMNEVFKIAFSYPIEIKAPLLGITKDIILTILQKTFGINKEILYTGYREFS
jgi:7-cyano-7-deazaguanine synthase